MKLEFFNLMKRAVSLRFKHFSELKLPSYIHFANFVSSLSQLYEYADSLHLGCCIKKDLFDKIWCSLDIDS